MIKPQEIFTKLKSITLDFYVSALLAVVLPLVMWSYYGWRVAVLTHIGVMTAYVVLVAYKDRRS